MSNYEGVIERDDLGPGAYVLVTDDGQRLHLAGCDRRLLEPGKAVRLEGTLDADAVGFGMTGDPVLRVERGAALA